MRLKPVSLDPSGCGIAVDKEIESEFVRTLEALRSMGYDVVRSKYDPVSFGNWYVEFRGRGRRFSVSKDRSQYFVQGDVEELKQVDLYRAFNDLSELSAKLLAWAAA